MKDDSASDEERRSTHVEAPDEQDSINTHRRNGSNAATAVLSPPTTSPPKSEPRTRTKAKKTGNWRQTFSSLSNRNFLMLWLGMLFLMAGMQMQMLARGYLVYDLTGSASLLGLVNAGMAIPMLSLSLFGGAFADRFERKRIIQVAQILSAIMAFVVGLAIMADSIAWYHLMVVSFIQGSLFAFMMPARQAIIPQLVGKEQLSNAMALNSAAMSSMTLAAPAMAGGLYAFAGPHNVYFIIGIFGVLAVIFTTMLPKTGTGLGKKSGPMVKEIAAGFSYIGKSPLVMVLLVMGLSTTLLAMPFRFLMPVYVVDVYRLGPDYMGLLVSIMGGGSLVGALFIAAIGEWRRGMLLIIGSFFSAVALMLIAVFPVYLMGLLFMIPLGLGDSGRRTLNQSLIMEEVEDQYRGRVMSVFMLNFGLMPLGVLPSAILIDIFGPQMIVGSLGLLLLVFTLGILLTQKRLREMP
jgi:MFS family permease